MFFHYTTYLINDQKKLFESSWLNKRNGSLNKDLSKIAKCPLTFVTGCVYAGEKSHFASTVLDNI